MKSNSFSLILIKNAIQTKHNQKNKFRIEDN